MANDSAEVPLFTYDYMGRKLLDAAFGVMSGNEQGEDIDGAEVAAFVMSVVCASYHHTEGSKPSFSNKIEASIYKICMNDYVGDIASARFFEIRHARRREYGHVIWRWLGGEFTREQAAVVLTRKLLEHTDGSDSHPAFQDFAIETRNAIAITSAMAPRTVATSSLPNT